MFISRGRQIDDNVKAKRRSLIAFYVRCYSYLESEFQYFPSTKCIDQGSSRFYFKFWHAPLSQYSRLFFRLQNEANIYLEFTT